MYWLISRASAVSGGDLRTADAGHDENGRADVNFTLTGDGGRRFAAFTGAHVGDKLAVVLDNRVKSVATIQEQIHDQGRITGSFTPQETQDLALTLRSGALPAGIKYLQEVTVGPSLGADSIRQGVRAAIIGMIAVMVFMLFYYRAAGINADLGLFLNLVILLGFLGFTGATLTLPGIAGVILTVGMGVDSNVLIFERIREELRHGKTPPSAVDQGFAHAWIDDSRYPRDHDRLGHHPVPVRNRAGARFRRDPELRSGGQPVHLGLRFARHFRSHSQPPSAWRGIEYLRG